VPRLFKQGIYCGSKAFVRGLRYLEAIRLGERLRYYGGKGKLLSFIQGTISNVVPDSARILDLFSGTGVVGLQLRKSGHPVHANDILELSDCLNHTNLVFDRQSPTIKSGKASDLVNMLNSTKGFHDFVTESYSPIGSVGRMYFSAENAKKIDAIRTKIHHLFIAGELTKPEERMLVGLLLKGINRVSNTTGTYGAYLKNWDPRAEKPLVLDPKDLHLDGPLGYSTVGDALDFENLQFTNIEITYCDPPYNSRDYSSNYFLPEVIAMGWFDKELTPKGKTGTISLPTKKSKFSSSRTVIEAFSGLLQNTNTPFLLISYNDEGLISIPSLVEIMSQAGRVREFTQEHKRFRSINQDGTRIKTKEHLLLLERT